MFIDTVKMKTEVGKHEFYLLSLGDGTIPMPEFDLFNSNTPLTCNCLRCFSKECDHFLISKGNIY